MSIVGRVTLWIVIIILVVVRVAVVGGTSDASGGVYSKGRDGKRMLRV